MKLYLSKVHSDEDGPYADEGKMGILYSNREDLIKLCDFFELVRKELSSKESLHLHFRDSFDNWDRANHIDLEINITNENARKANL